MESPQEKQDQPFFCMTLKGFVKILRLVRTGEGTQGGGHVCSGVEKTGLGSPEQLLLGHLVSSHVFPDARHSSIALSAERRTIAWPPLQMV